MGSNMCSTEARLDGKVAIVTGGSSGIGYEAAKSLAKKGARVIIASRDQSRLEDAANRIQTETGNHDIAYRAVNFASFKSIRNFAQKTIDVENRVDILINNAGAIGLPDELTEDGLNLTMQVNYLGAFLLTYLLLPIMKASAPSRVITGTASTMYIGELDFNHWNETGRSNLVTSLSNSKLADALFSVELAKRLEGKGVTSNSFDPFVVSDTRVLQNIPPELKAIVDVFIGIIGQSKEVVGEQIAYLATAPELESVSGRNYKFCGVWPIHWLAEDRNVTSKLWDVSKELVHIEPIEDWDDSNVLDLYK